jgi:hypothetical protein
LFLVELVELSRAKLRGGMGQGNPQAPPDVAWMPCGSRGHAAARNFVSRCRVYSRACDVKNSGYAGGVATESNRCSHGVHGNLTKSRYLSRSIPE